MTVKALLSIEARKRSVIIGDWDYHFHYCKTAVSFINSNKSNYFPIIDMSITVWLKTMDH